MDEYQSIELHFGAARTYYDSYVFNESAFSGGSIAFVDDEDISLYEDKLKHVYPDESEGYSNPSSMYEGWGGPPVEIDRKYLGMLLGAKKLKTSLDFNFLVSASQLSFGGFGANTDIKGTVKGSFHGLTLYAYNVSSEENNTEYSAGWYSKDTTSKAAQLNSSYKKINENSAALYNNAVTSPSNYNLSPSALPSISYDSRFFFPREFTEEGDYILPDPITISVNKSHNLAGDFSLESTIKSVSHSYFHIEFGVRFIVVTPTKVHLFPVISGTLVLDDEANTTAGITAVKKDTYRAVTDFEGGFTERPPVATSQVTFLGAQVPVYFYDAFSILPIDFPIHESASCAGTTFDISVEEEYISVEEEY